MQFLFRLLKVLYTYSIFIDRIIGRMRLTRGHLMVCVGNNIMIYFIFNLY